MSSEIILGAWVATGLTLFILTFLYQDNPLFKLAEHLYVGISVGYAIVKTYDTVAIRLIYEPMVKQGDWSLLIPLAIGSLMLTRYVPKAAWMSRISFAFVVGVGSGLAIPRVISSYILKQIEDTVRPLMIVPFEQALAVLISSRAALALAVLILLFIAAITLYLLVRLGASKLSGALQVTSSLLAAIVVIALYRFKILTQSRQALSSTLQPIAEVFDINSLVVLLGVICVLFYFFFSVEHTGPGKVVARTGIIFLMIAFGAAFGYTVMARMSLLIGRLTDLIEYARPQYGWATWWLLAITIVTLIVFHTRRKGTEPPQ